MVINFNPKVLGYIVLKIHFGFRDGPYCKNGLDDNTVNSQAAVVRATNPSPSFPPPHCRGSIKITYSMLSHQPRYPHLEKPDSPHLVLLSRRPGKVVATTSLDSKPGPQCLTFSPIRPDVLFSVRSSLRGIQLLDDNGNQHSSRAHRPGPPSLPLHRVATVEGADANDTPGRQGPMIPKQCFLPVLLVVGTTRYATTKFPQLALSEGNCDGRHPAGAAPTTQQKQQQPQQLLAKGHCLKCAASYLDETRGRLQKRPTLQWKPQPFSRRALQWRP